MCILIVKEFFNIWKYAYLFTSLLFTTIYVSCNGDLAAFQAVDLVIDSRWLRIHPTPAREPIKYLSLNNGGGKKKFCISICISSGRPRKLSSVKSQPTSDDGSADPFWFNWQIWHIVCHLSHFDVPLLLPLEATSTPAFPFYVVPDLIRVLEACSLLHPRSICFLAPRSKPDHQT